MRMYLPAGVVIVLGIGSAMAFGQDASGDAGRTAATKAAAPALGESAPEAAPHEPGDPKKGFVHVDKLPQEPPIMVLDYPWKVHTRPSVEVRILEPGESEGGLHPLNFVKDLMKAEVTNAVYEARDGAAEVPTYKTFTKRERTFEIRGQRNLMDKPSACVVFPGTPKGSGAEGKETASRVVFFLLDSWSLDRRTLRLELPAPEFAKPGKLRVWFLREGNVLWAETIDWPGLGKP